MILKHAHKYILGIAGLLLCVVSVSNGQQSVSKTPQEETRSGSINGRVVSESGQPLGGATVFLRTLGSMSAGRTLASDNEGNFQISGLDPALYSISASFPAYTTLPGDPDLPPVYYRVGDTVRLEMVKGGVITGTVTNAAGEPVIGIRVRAYRIRDQKGQPTIGVGERPTDDRGIYRMYGLVPGTYLVFAGGGTPSAFSVGPYDTDAPTYAPSSTRDNAAEVPVRAGEESLVDIRFRGESGHAISGKVVVPNMMNASVVLTPAGDGSVAVGNAFQIPGTRGFAITGVADGDYDIIAQVTNAGPAVIMEVTYSDPLRVSVKGADVTGIELTPKPLATITGRVLLEPSKVPDCKAKRRPEFVETLVELKRNVKKTDNDGRTPFFRSANVASPDKDGNFVMRSVRAGQYVFNPRFFARYWYIDSISFASPSAPSTGAKTPTSNTKSEIARNWLNVKAGDRLTGLNVVLSEGAASVRGQLSAPEGATLPDKNYVYLVPSEKEKADDVLRFFTVEAATDGTFSLGSLPPGKYWVVTKTQIEGDLTVEKLRLPSTSEARIQLRRSAETLKDELVLKPCQNLSDYKLTIK